MKKKRMKVDAKPVPFKTVKIDLDAHKLLSEEKALQDGRPIERILREWIFLAARAKGRLSEQKEVLP